MFVLMWSATAACLSTNQKYFISEGRYRCSIQNTTCTFDPERSKTTSSSFEGVTSLAGLLARLAERSALPAFARSLDFCFRFSAVSVAFARQYHDTAFSYLESESETSTNRQRTTSFALSFCLQARHISFFLPCQISCKANLSLRLQGMCSL